MSFFDAPPFDEKSSSQSVIVAPPRVGPTPGIIPSNSTQRAIVFAADQVALMVDQVRVYENGFLASFGLWINPKLPDPDLYQPFLRPRRGPESRLRIGIEYPTGSKWTNWNSKHGEDDPGSSTLAVTPLSGTGDQFHWQMDYWVRPLPSPGRLKIAAIWPAHNIPETIIELDANELRQRATEAKSLWD